MLTEEGYIIRLQCAADVQPDLRQSLSPLRAASVDTVLEACVSATLVDSIHGLLPADRWRKLVSTTTSHAAEKSSEELGREIRRPVRHALPHLGTRSQAASHPGHRPTFKDSTLPKSRQDTVVPGRLSQQVQIWQRRRFIQSGTPAQTSRLQQTAN